MIKTSDQTSRMLCNVLVQASHELLADSNIQLGQIKDNLRQDCAKLPVHANIIQQVSDTIAYSSMIDHCNS